MRGLRSGLVLLGLGLAVLVSVALSLRAQERDDTAAKERAARGVDRSPLLEPVPPFDPARPAPTRQDPYGQPLLEPVPPLDPARTVPSLSVQDALQRPFSFPFATPTSLSDVCEHLRHALKAPVVLDLAGLDRQEVKPDDTVQLQLEGVRLKTGLKLLLDQVGLSYKVVAEDNLLIVTDLQGSGEPIDRMLSEIKSIHRDIHDLQDAVDDIVWSLGLDEGAKMRKPTIIEELPGDTKPEEKPQSPPPGAAEKRRSRPGA